jgi:hypothetical protein
MARSLDFIKAAGERGWPSVSGTFIFVSVSILEHFWDHTVASYVFIVLAAAIFSWGAFAAWSSADKQVKKLEEQLADRVPRVKGEIVLGYLEIGKRYEKDRLLMYDGDCVATFYLRVVNHSDQDAWMVLPPTLKLTINRREYASEYVIPTPYALIINDSELKGDRRILDLFGFSVGGMNGVFQKPRLHHGWLMFNIPDSQVHLDGKNHISGAVSINFKDTLGGIHPIGSPEITLRLNKIGMM